MGAIASQITSLVIVYSTPFIRAEIKENIKAPRHWPLCGELTVSGEFPAQMASNAENVSIWWRHHASVGMLSKGEIRPTICPALEKIVIRSAFLDNF